HARRAGASGDPVALRTRRRTAPHARSDRQAVRPVPRAGSPNRARGDGQAPQRRAGRPAPLVRELTTRTSNDTYARRTRGGHTAAAAVATHGAGVLANH